MTNQQDDPMRQLQATLRRLKKGSLTGQLRLIEQQFPTIVEDARQFLAKSNGYLPWEFGIAFAEGELEALQEKYRAQCSRHRPSSPEVPAETDLFYEACELLYQRWVQENEERADITWELRALFPDRSEEDLKPYVEEEMEQRRKEW